MEDCNCRQAKTIGNLEAEVNQLKHAVTGNSRPGLIDTVPELASEIKMLRAALMEDKANREDLRTAVSGVVRSFDDAELRRKIEREHEEELHEKEIKLMNKKSRNEKRWMALYMAIVATASVLAAVFI